MLQIIILAATALLVGIDQLTKWLAVEYLQEGEPFPIIDGVFELLLHKNPGAAFGLFEGQRWLFMGVTVVVIVVLAAILMSGKYRQYRLVNLSGTLIIAGGIGNMIDRVRMGHVIDFLYFRLIDFPIFNFADCCVVVGAVLLLIFFFFFYEEKPKSQQEEPAPADSLPATDEGAAEQALQEEETPHGGEELDRSAGKGRGED